MLNSAFLVMRFISARFRRIYQSMEDPTKFIVCRNRWAVFRQQVGQLFVPLLMVLRT